jgi:NADH-quinone oxidoreductase subunit E/NADP-reducing hydrogenase subunit HndA
MVTTDEKKQAELKKFIDEVKHLEHSESQLIKVLHKAQEIYSFLPREVMDDISEQMEIPTAHIWGVATFYHYFNLTPPGKLVISVCLGTACYVKGAGEILDAIKKYLGVEVGGITEDGLFSLQEARCLGACGLAPVVMVNDKIHGNLTGKSAVKLLDQYRKDASASGK